MVPFDKQAVTVVRQSKIGVDTSYEPPSGAVHVIANASQTEEASLIFCYIGVPNV